MKWNRRRRRRREREKQGDQIGRNFTISEMLFKLVDLSTDEILSLFCYEKIAQIVAQPILPKLMQNLIRGTK
jgi:hypothetical protein